LCPLGSASQQNDKLTATLREVHAPPGTEMDAKLEDTVAHWLDIAEKTSFQPLDPSNHNATN